MPTSGSRASTSHPDSLLGGDCSDVGAFDLGCGGRVAGGLEKCRLEVYVSITVMIHMNLTMKRTYLMVVKVLTGINRLVLYQFDNSVHAKSQQRSHKRAKPVYVMISRPVPRDYAGSKTSGGIQTSSGEEHADHFSNKECKANSDGCQVCCFVLLGSEHEDREDEKGGKEHFEKNTLCDRSSGSKGSSHVERTREDGRHNPG